MYYMLMIVGLLSYYEAQAMVSVEEPNIFSLGTLGSKVKEMKIEDSEIDITWDIVRIVTFSYELAENSERGINLIVLYNLIKTYQNNNLKLSAETTVKALENVIKILNKNEQNLPGGSNWGLIIKSIKARIREIANPSHYKTQTTIACNCNNCKFKSQK